MDQKENLKESSCFGKVKCPRLFITSFFCSFSLFKRILIIQNLWEWNTCYRLRTPTFPFRSILEFTLLVMCIFKRCLLGRVHFQSFQFGLACLPGLWSLRLVSFSLPFFGCFLFINFRRVSSYMGKLVEIIYYHGWERLEFEALLWFSCLQLLSINHMCFGFFSANHMLPALGFFLCANKALPALGFSLPYGQACWDYLHSVPSPSWMTTFNCQSKPKKCLLDLDSEILII